MPQSSTFDANLRAARARANLNQSQLAAKIGMAQSNLSKWERGSSTPTVENLLLLAEALDTTAADLLSNCQHPPSLPATPGRAKAPTSSGAATRTNHQRTRQNGPPLVTRNPRRQSPVEVA